MKELTNKQEDFLLEQAREDNECCFCGEDVGKFGNNAQPLENEKCCDDCNESLVIPARLKQLGYKK